MLVFGKILRTYYMADPLYRYNWSYVIFIWVKKLSHKFFIIIIEKSLQSLQSEAYQKKFVIIMSTSTHSNNNREA